ncbi:hypothetical protein [Streptomyces sp. NPDC001568]|uniref:hypothetical protein n=1 Tax=Streptomyces sp. NPDC001568 TaxID=3364588 RepID=UPI00369EEF76
MLSTRALTAAGLTAGVLALTGVTAFTAQADTGPQLQASGGKHPAVATAAHRIPTEKAITALPTEKAIRTLPTEKAISALPSEKAINALPSEKAIGSLRSEKAIRSLPTEKAISSLPAGEKSVA